MSINYLPIDNSIALVTSAVTDALTGDAITDATITAAVLTVGGVSLCSAAMTHDAGGIYKGTLDLSTASPDLVLNTHYYLQLSASNYALVWKRLLRAEDRPLVGSGSVSIDLTPGTSGLTTANGVLKGNGAGAITAATAGTDYVAPGVCLLWHGATTKAYTTVPLALAAAVTGDTILLGPGTFALGAAGLDLSLAGTGTVHLRGSGRYATIITSTLGLPLGVGTPQTVIHPGSGSVVSSLTISCTLADGTFQLPWGTGPSQSAFTGALLDDVKIIGNSDGIYVNHASACTAKIINCEVLTNFDAAALIKVSSGQAHIIQAYASTFSAIGPNTAGAGGSSTGICRTIRCATGLFEGFAVDIICTNGGNTTHAAAICSTGGAITLHSGRITSSNSGGATNYNLNQSSTGALKIMPYALVYDATATTGTITYLPNGATTFTLNAGSNATFADGAAGFTGTLGTAPAAGNPTIWVPATINGVTMYIPAWEP